MTRDQTGIPSAPPVWFFERIIRDGWHGTCLLTGSAWLSDPCGRDRGRLRWASP